MKLLPTHRSLRRYPAGNNEKHPVRQEKTNGDIYIGQMEKLEELSKYTITKKK